MTDAAGADDRRVVASKTDWFRGLGEGSGVAASLPMALRRVLEIVTLDRAVDVVEAERKRLEDEVRAKVVERERLRLESAALEAQGRRTREAEARALSQRRLGALRRARREGAEEGLRAIGFVFFPIWGGLGAMYWSYPDDGPGGGPFPFWPVYFTVVVACGLFWGVRHGNMRFREAERKGFQ